MCLLKISSILIKQEIGKAAGIRGSTSRQSFGKVVWQQRGDGGREISSTTRDTPLHAFQVATPSQGHHRTEDFKEAPKQHPQAPGNDTLTDVSKLMHDSEKRRGNGGFGSSADRARTQRKSNGKDFFPQHQSLPRPPGQLGKGGRTHKWRKRAKATFFHVAMLC